MHLVAAICLAGATFLATGIYATTQNLAGLFANWKDLETWSRAVPETREVELGLGLQPGGQDGTVMMAFLGRRSVWRAEPPRTLTVQLGAGFLANPTLVREPTLVFVADAGTADHAAIDVSDSMRVDDPAPGGYIQNGVAEIRASDFARLAYANTVSANVLGFHVALRTDQIEAMRVLADDLQLPAPVSAGPRQRP